MVFNKISYGDEAPIAAFATVPGKSALTMIRCSGKGSIELVSSVFMSGGKKSSLSPLLTAAGNTVVYGWIVNSKNNSVCGSEKIDEVLVSVFRAPKSYTGEDSLDISCHGGFVTGSSVLNVLKNVGFREALPGEFTFRGFMNGKLDLTQSEAVMELVSAKTETGRSHAVSRLSGSLHSDINKIKLLLVEVLAAAEIYLDYSEDEISADIEEAEGKLPKRDVAIAALSHLKALSASWQLERIYQDGVSVVIAGRPNAGKSSLFNSLLKEDRSIVTEAAGTTRDWIEAWVSLEGFPIRLIDTAGLRETSDIVETIGVERSLKLLQEAEIVLYLIDGECGLTNEDLEFIASQDEPLRKSGRYCLFVWNKADVAPPPQPFSPAGVSLLSVSAKTGGGIAELNSAIVSAIRNQVGADLSGIVDTAGLGTARQKTLVDCACSALEEALILAKKEEPLDLIAPLLRETVNSLGEITGEVSTADVLEKMFSRFCVGK
ncbi:MAG: tRNA uridine-5-carboxymethylaminomethyl(34) synthesis GTPase MnmE [Treponema sp.]|nr:tRNA uridine-5-carboxymethylaminomethyl(34) synthesis GTPase MnmE [Treponema sp.]